MSDGFKVTGFLELPKAPTSCKHCQNAEGMSGPRIQLFPFLQVEYDLDYETNKSDKSYELVHKWVCTDCWAIHEMDYPGRIGDGRI